MNKIYRALVFPALMVFVTVVAGCAVGPEYRRSEATIIPEAYSGPEGEWRIAVSQARLPKGNWWEIFGDAELDRLEAAADSLGKPAHRGKGFLPI